MKDKVLYHIGHHAFLLVCLLHKMNYHPESEAFFLYDISVNPFNSSTYKYVKRINEKIDPFGKLILYAHDSFRNLESDEAALEEIVNIYDNTFKKTQIDLEEMSYVYLTFDEWNPFAVYVNYKKINVPIGSILMTARYGRFKGDVSEGALKWQAQRDIHASNIHRKYDAYCLTDNITQVYRLFEAEEDFYANMPYIKIDEMLDNISDEQTTALLKLYEYDELKINEDVSYQLILIAGWFKNKIEKAHIDYIALYQQAIDYFKENSNIIMKFHPRYSFSQEEVRKYFPAVTNVMDGLFPSQLLVKCKNLKFSSVLSLASTGSRGLSSHYAKDFSFDNFWYFVPKRQPYFWINRFFVSLELADFLGCKNIRYFGLAVEIVSKVVKYWPQYNFKSVTWYDFLKGETKLNMCPIGTALLLGDPDWYREHDPEEILKYFYRAVLSNRDDICYIMFNTNKDVNFDLLDESVRKYVYVMEIAKRKDRDEIRCDLEREAIYIFSKNKSLIERIREFNTHKRLYNTGITIYTKQLVNISDSNMLFKESEENKE